MSVYNAREYWNRRATRQGRSYVAKCGYTPAQQNSQMSYFLDAVKSRIKDQMQSVLDFGCGVGRFAPLLAGQAVQYEGVDICSQGLKMCPDLSNARFQQLRQDIPLPNGNCDAVVTVTVLQHISDIEIKHWLQEIRRVCCDDARVVIIDHNPSKGRKWSSHMFVRPADFYVAALGLVNVQSELVASPDGKFHYLLSGNTKG